MATKNQLLEQARQLGLGGISNMNKAQLQEVLTNNPCQQLDRETCRNMSAEELRGIARKCKVVMGRKSQDQICQDIYDKFHGQAQPDFGPGDPVNDPCYQLDLETCRTMPREELRRNARKCKVIMGRKSQDQICQDIYDKFHAESPQPRRQRSPPRTRTGPQSRARTRVRPTLKTPTPPQSRARTPPRARPTPKAPTPPRSRARTPILGLGLPQNLPQKHQHHLDLDLVLELLPKCQRRLLGLDLELHQHLDNVLLQKHFASELQHLHALHHQKLALLRVLLGQHQHLNSL